MDILQYQKVEKNISEFIYENGSLSAINPTNGEVLYTVPTIANTTRTITVTGLAVGSDGVSYITAINLDYTTQFLISYNQQGQLWNTSHFFYNGLVNYFVRVIQDFVAVSAQGDTDYSLFTHDGILSTYLTWWGILNEDATNYYYNNIYQTIAGNISLTGGEQLIWQVNNKFPENCYLWYDSTNPSISATLSVDESVLYSTIDGISNCSDISAVRFIDSKTGNIIQELNLPGAITARGYLVWSAVSPVKSLVFVNQKNIFVDKNPTETIIAYKY